MRKLTIVITVPDDFDTGPIFSNIETDLAYIQTGTGPDESLHCPSLAYITREEQVDDYDVNEEFNQ